VWANVEALSPCASALKRASQIVRLFGYKPIPEALATVAAITAT